MLFKGKDPLLKKLSTLEIDGLLVHLVQKRIRHVTIRVYPPEGLIRVSAPLSLSQEGILKSILPRLDWMKIQQARILKLSEQTREDTTRGPMRYYLGTRYPFEVVEHDDAHSALVEVSGTLKLYTKKNQSAARQKLALKEAYRKALSEHLVLFLDRWSLILGVHAKTWTIKQMKTKWGSCHIQDRKIIFNLELAKHSLASIEYVVAHELIHLIEPSHNARFKRFMTEAIPNWKILKAELQKIPVERD
jgi:predicted metal-dependent hydrolase